MFFYEGNTHLPIEQHAAVAQRIPTASSSSGRARRRRTTCIARWPRCCRLPAAHIRVIATPNGGGFGGKSDPFNHEVVVCEGGAAARPSGEDLPDARRGVLLSSRPASRADAVPDRRHEGRRDHRRGPADAARRRRVRIYGVASTFYTGALQTVTYDVPRYRFRGCRVFTNKPPCGPKRGHGTPQARFGQEVQLDKIAERLQARSGGDAAAGSSRRPNTLTANYPAHRHASAWPSASTESSSSSGWTRASSASCRSGAASASRARRICPARACRSTGTTCRTRACS